MRKIYILGGATVDISAQSYGELIPGDSNPGRVRYSFGGVGHNIAANLALAGCPVSFITAFSDDAFGRQIRESCQALGMDLSLSQLIEGVPSSVYAAVVDPRGEMNIAVADMELLSHFKVAKLTEVFASLKKDDLAVIDTNFTEEQIAGLIGVLHCRIYADPISTTKAHKIVPFLSRLEYFKPNLLEAEAISGLKCRGESDYQPLLKWFRDRGVRHIVISMAEKGLIAADEDGYYHIGNIANKIVNTTGAGDAFMAGYMYGQYHGHGFVDCLRYSLAAAAIALESHQTVNLELDGDKLEKYYIRVRDESAVEVLAQEV